jgi:hypothetical protein
MDKLNEWDLAPTEYDKGALAAATDSAEYIPLISRHVLFFNGTYKFKQTFFVL